MAVVAVPFILYLVRFCSSKSCTRNEYGTRRTVRVLVQYSYSYTQGVIIAESSSPDKRVDSLPFSGFLPISHSEEYRYSYEYCIAYLHPEIPDSG